MMTFVKLVNVSDKYSARIKVVEIIKKEEKEAVFKDRGGLIHTLREVGSKWLHTWGEMRNWVMAPEWEEQKWWHMDTSTPRQAIRSLRGSGIKIPEKKALWRLVRRVIDHGWRYEIPQGSTVSTAMMENRLEAKGFKFEWGDEESLFPIKITFRDKTIWVGDY